MHGKQWQEPRWMVHAHGRAASTVHGRGQRKGPRGVVASRTTRSTAHSFCMLTTTLKLAATDVVPKTDEPWQLSSAAAGPEHASAVPMNALTAHQA